MRKTVGTVTATSWLGSPSVSRSSPPSLTLCYVRRLHEKDTGASSDQPQTFWLGLLLQLKSGFSHRFELLVYIQLQIYQTCRSSQIHRAFNWVCCQGFHRLCGKKANSVNRGCIWVCFQAGVLGWISRGHLRILDLKCALMRMRCYNKLRSIIVSGL